MEDYISGLRTNEKSRRKNKKAKRRGRKLKEGKNKEKRFIPPPWVLTKAAEEDFTVKRKLVHEESVFSCLNVIVS